MTRHNDDQFSPEDIEAARQGAEKAARTMAGRQGLALHKARVRNRAAPDYGLYALIPPGYRTIDSDFTMTLEQVVDYLNKRQHSTPAPKAE
jgi:hypothetical protein